MDEDTRATEAARTLRPLGYAAIGVVWLILTAISLLLWAALPLIIPAAAGPLSQAPGIVSLRDDPSNLTAFILTMVVLPPFVIYVLLAVTAGSGSLMLLAFTYAGRARDPRYADRRLSRTSRTVDALGSPLTAFLPKALSLLPAWRSPRTDALAAVTMLAFRPGFRLVMASWVLGLCYFFTVAWALWPVSGGTLLGCLVVSILLGTAGAWLLARSAIARYRTLSARLNDETDAAAATPS